jgi:predicted component of type VI protein secretion system
MNYTLQVVRGRTEAGSLRLIEGVNSIGRHDDCLIRIRSSQVSRRHCELFEDDGRLIIRDLGSANGTFVNGKRIGAQQVVKPGDVITVGGVTLRIDADSAPASAASSSPADTAEQEALTAIPDDGDDFEVGLGADEAVFDEPAFDEPVDHLDVIPLDDEPPPEPAKPASKPKSKAKGEPAAKAEEAEAPGDDAVAQFLMDLKLDEED